MTTPFTPLTLLRRGLIAGGAAGLLAGAFSFAVAEPLMDHAVDLESARSEAEDAAAGVHEHAVEMFTRNQQHFGLLTVTFFTALAFGALFAIVYTLVHRRDVTAEPWKRSVTLAAAAFTGVFLLPFLRYPANPPGVGNSDTIDLRQYSYLGSIAISVLVLIAAWLINSRLAEQGTAAPVRQLSVAGVLVLGLAALFLLPNNPDQMEVPPQLLWDFRLLSIATTLLIWAGTGVGFGLLNRRAAAKAEA